MSTLYAKRWKAAIGGYTLSLKSIWSTQQVPEPHRETLSQKAKTKEAEGDECGNDYFGVCCNECVRVSSMDTQLEKRAVPGVCFTTFNTFEASPSM